MKLFQTLLTLLFLAPVPAFAQGVRMSADFLPLAVGNRWVYDVMNEQGTKVGDMDIMVQDHTIVDGRSFYVFTRFPFTTSDDTVRMVRYDRQEREFLRIANDEEGPMFLADGSSTEVLTADSSGLPQKFVLNLDTMALTFQRGVGIVEARLLTPDGIRIAKIKNVRLGEGSGAVGVASRTAAAASAPPPTAPTPQQQRTKDLIDNVTTISEENPRLSLEANQVPGGTQFLLTVTNTSQKLLPFHFNSGQSYDFVVVDPVTNQEVWRWSRRMFFSQVIRDEAIRARDSWKFEAVWNHQDNGLNPITEGRYQVKGIVSSQPQIESEPVSLEFK